MPESLVAEFADAGRLVAALRRLRALGYERLEGYAPFDLRRLDDAVALRPSRAPLAMLAGGIVGGVGGYLLQWWTSAVDYPLTVGAMPFHAVPAFIPITFESLVLGACLAGAAAILIGGGLPRLWHPLDQVDGFERASRDRFFLAVAGSTEQLGRARAELAACGAMSVQPMAGEPA